MMPSRKQCPKPVSQQVIHFASLPFRPASELWYKVRKRVAFDLRVKPLSAKQEAITQAMQVVSGLGLVYANRGLEISAREVSSGGIEVDFGRLDIQIRRSMLWSKQIVNLCTVHILNDEFLVRWTKEVYSCIPKNNLAVAVDLKYCQAALIGLLTDFYKYDDESHFHLDIQTRLENNKLWLPPDVAKVQVFNGNLLSDSDPWKNRVELLLDYSLAIIGGFSVYDSSF